MPKQTKPARDRRHHDLGGAAPPLAGIDEAGRGPLAGPVVAAAVIWAGGPWPDGLTDSKKLSQRARERLYGEVLAGATSHGIGMASPREIDTLNIRRATFLAMERAVAALALAPGTALVDGNALPRLPCPGHAIVGGDSLVPEISAASILAKVTRDRLMADLAARFPVYGWAQNMGYPTAAHRAALFRHGPSPHHRRSFAPVRAALEAR